VIVLSLWTSLSPPHWDLSIQSTDNFGRLTETYGFCASDDRVPFLATLAVLNLGALSFAIIQAYKARNISTEFAESEYIFKAMLLILLVCFIGIPVLVIAKDDPAAFYFVFTGIIFVTCYAILLLVFVPKMLYVKESQKKTGPRVTVSTHSVPGSIHNSCEMRGVEDEGTRILTTKTQNELLEEIKMLKRLLESDNNRTRTAEKVNGDLEDERPISKEDSARDKLVSFASSASLESKGREVHSNDASDLQTKSNVLYPELPGSTAATAAVLLDDHNMPFEASNPNRMFEHYDTQESTGATWDDSSSQSEWSREK
jgi:hypothetical protein